jgi:predicted dehydrogenase
MEIVRWGILGVSGHFLMRVAAPASKTDVVRLRGIASRSAAKAKQAAEQWGIAKAYGSYEELLADKDIDAVFTSLPNHLHVEWIRKAADAGKHILCEKPLAMNAVEARESVEYARRRGVLLMEAFYVQVSSSVDKGGRNHPNR